jgi:hypothetical protein
VPRISDDDVAADGSGFHVAGVWRKALRELRNVESTSVYRYLDDPRLVLSLDPDEYLALLERARSDAGDRHTVRLAAGEPVSVSRAVLRCVVPKDAPVLEDRSLSRFTVHPDDSVAPVYDD